MRPVQSAADVPRAVAGGWPVFQIEIQRPQRSAAHEVVVERGIEREIGREWPGELGAEEQIVAVEVVTDMCAVGGTGLRRDRAPAPPLRIRRRSRHRYEQQHDQQSRDPSVHDALQSSGMQTDRKREGKTQ